MVAGRSARTGTDRHFACTACGQCCFGWLPLTLEDAFANAGRFPLAMVWTPVPEQTRSFELTAQLGTVTRLPNRKRLALSVVPTVYIPRAFPCPALSPENLCRIQATKPSRCRAMPFYPYRREDDQLDLLRPRKGWACDVSAAAPLVYRNSKIQDRTDFDRERDALLAQAPELRAYADQMLKHYPALVGRLQSAAQRPTASPVIVGFHSFLRHHRHCDPIAFAREQHPLLSDFAARTADAPTLAEYHGFYRDSAAELAWLAQQA